MNNNNNFDVGASLNNYLHITVPEAVFVVVSDPFMT
jgi:hypothetical protein